MFILVLRCFRNVNIVVYVLLSMLMFSFRFLIFMLRLSGGLHVYIAFVLCSQCFILLFLFCSRKFNYVSIWLSPFLLYLCVCINVYIACMLHSQCLSCDLWIYLVHYDFIWCLYVCCVYVVISMCILLLCCFSTCLYWLI